MRKYNYLQIQSSIIQDIYHFYTFQGYPVMELSSFIFFIFPMAILIILYIRMGLSIKKTSGIQRNLPGRSVSNAINSVPRILDSIIPLIDANACAPSKNPKIGKILDFIRIPTRF